MKIKTEKQDKTVFDFLDSVLTDYDKEIRWVEDYNRHWNENEWDITEYLETEYGFIIRFVECRETTAKEFWDRINK